jgi:pyruvate/2-oxoglutarate dehydrogenase complex dihydrolipoamide acyltransferase (E2) component
VATDVLLPKLGFAMNEGTVAEWLSADGSQVTQGEPLFSLESDKSVVEVESPASGTLNILEPAGSVLIVGTVLARIV